MKKTPTTDGAALSCGAPQADGLPRTHAPRATAAGRAGDEGRRVMECAGTRRDLVRFRVPWVLLVSQSSMPLRAQPLVVRGWRCV